MALTRLHEATLAVLEQCRHRPDTHKRVAHLHRLQGELAHMRAGDRGAAIRERMGLSRSGYYKLLRLAKSLQTSVDSFSV